MSATSNPSWNKVKAAIILRYGTLDLAAKNLNCSVDGIRLAVEGRCPGVLEKLRGAGLTPKAITPEVRTAVRVLKKHSFRGVSSLRK